MRFEPIPRFHVGRWRFERAGLLPELEVIVGPTEPLQIIAFPLDAYGKPSKAVEELIMKLNGLRTT